MRGRAAKRLACALLLLAAPAGAERAGVWEVECQPIAEANRMGCLARSMVVSSSTGTSTLRVEVIPQGALGNANAVLRLFLPHGVALNANLGVQIDGGEVYKVPLMTSDRDGVTAFQFIGADVVDRLRKGAALSVTAVTPEGNTVRNSVSLVGLTLALDSIARLEDAP